MAIPLLAGESLTTDLPVDNGSVVVSMAANQRFLSWESNVKPQNALLLTY
ncbi:MAG: hypothetical protein KUG73_06930 [Pseudomonadales bacterium]|nr:hypothetical protein [Pseudomonadales bacterium]